MRLKRGVFREMAAGMRFEQRSIAAVDTGDDGVLYPIQMSHIVEIGETALSRRIRAERTERGWTLAELAERSGVSKAMLSRIERDEASPTAALLVRVAAAFGMTLSQLIARAEGQAGQLLAAAAQPSWRDPETGYVRRHLSPLGENALDLIHVELPAGAEVALPAASYSFIHQLIWLISGRLDFHEGETVYEMHPGDCFRLGPPVDRIFAAPGPLTATYIVALAKR